MKLKEGPDWSRKETDMKKSLLVRMIILFVTTITLSGCIVVPLGWYDGGHYDRGYHNRGYHGGYGGYGYYRGDRY